MLRYGGYDVSDVYYGAQQIKKIFAGTELVHSAPISKSLWACGFGSGGIFGYPNDGHNRLSLERIGTGANWNQVLAVDNSRLLLINRKSELYYHGKWGNNGYTLLTKIGTASDWKKCACGNNHIVALNASGKLYVSLAINYNDSGYMVKEWSFDLQLLDGGKTYRDVASSNGAIIAVTTSGEMYIFLISADINDTAIGSGRKIGSLSNWESVSTCSDPVTGNSRCAAINAAGELYVWGENSNGGLCDGTYNDISIPTRLGTASNWLSVYIGTNICAINTAGELYVSRNNTFVKHNESTDWVSASLGRGHLAAINTAGELYTCVLNYSVGNESGQLGLGDTNLGGYYFTRVGSGHYSMVSCADYITAALKIEE